MRLRVIDFEIDISNPSEISFVKNFLGGDTSKATQEGLPTPDSIEAISLEAGQLNEHLPRPQPQYLLPPAQEHPHVQPQVEHTELVEPVALNALAHTQPSEQPRLTKRVKLSIFLIVWIAFCILGISALLPEIVKNMQQSEEVNLEEGQEEIEQADTGTHENPSNPAHTPFPIPSPAISD